MGGGHAACRIPGSVSGGRRESDVRKALVPKPPDDAVVLPLGVAGELVVVVPAGPPQRVREIVEKE